MTTNRFTRRFVLIAFPILLSSGCGQGPASEDIADSAAEQPIGIQETFPDSPGLIRTEIVNAAGRLVTVGYWLDRKKTGAWTDYTQDDRVFRLTTYVAGKKEGIYLELNTINQVTVRCFYHNDQRHGKYTEYAPEFLREERFYNNGKQDGITSVYSAPGKLIEQGYYKDGLREGISKWYDGAGNLTLQYEYHKGELVKK